MKLSEEKISNLTAEHEKYLTSTNEKLHQKESALDKQTEELKHLKSTTKS